MSGLIRLVYASRANFDPVDSDSGIEPTVARILFQSRKNNPREQIGGVLYYGNGYFFQCLEGKSDVVNALAARLMQDPRHSDVEILKVSQVDRRLFRNWSMKYVPLEQDVNRLLQKHEMKSFDPYNLSDGLIDELVALFVQLSSPQSSPDQDYSDKAEAAPTLWGRFKKLLGLG